MDLSVYGALWRSRGVIALLAAAIVARLPVTAAAVPMAFLAKDAEGTFTWAGLVAGAYAIGTGIGGPLWARLADRHGGRTVLIATGTAWSIAVGLLALLPDASVRTEAYGWMTTSGMAGSALGASLAGVLVERYGVGSAWGLAAGTTLLAAALMIHIPPLEPVVETG